MAKLSGPIGVLDSGVGGLTIVRELQRILPGEDIIYFGDSANCPYGNKSSEELITLGKNMLSFLFAAYKDWRYNEFIGKT